MIRNLAFQFKEQVKKNQKNSMVTKNCVICMTPGQTSLKILSSNLIVWIAELSCQLKIQFYHVCCAKTALL